tara:strand:+ start:190 stop:423 length:234 start_codon:yes stop_codon:yes gene_type:complete
VPQCKQEHIVDDLNAWDAAVVIERLFPEDDYSPNDESSSDASGSEEVTTRTTRIAAATILPSEERVATPATTTIADV